MPKILEATVKVKVLGHYAPLPSLLNNSVGGTFTDHATKTTIVFRIMDGQLIIGRTKPGIVFDENSVGTEWTEKEAKEYIDTVETLDKGYQVDLVTKYGPATLVINPLYE